MLGRYAGSPLALAAAVLVAAGAGGCGGGGEEPEAPAVSGEQRGVLSTIDDLQTASQRGDGAAICNELFTEALATSIQKASKRSCAAEVKDSLTSPDVQYAVDRDMRVTGSRATTTVRENSGRVSKLFFVKDGDRWRIERIQPAGSS